MMMAYLHKEGGIWNYADRGEIPSKCSPHLWHFKDTLYMNIYMGLLMMLTIITLNKWQQPCFRMTMTLKTWHMIIDEGGNMILCRPRPGLYNADLRDAIKMFSASVTVPRYIIRDCFTSVTKSIKTWKGENTNRPWRRYFDMGSLGKLSHNRPINCFNKYLAMDRQTITIYAAQHQLQKMKRFLLQKIPRTNHMGKKYSNKY